MNFSINPKSNSFALFIIVVFLFVEGLFFGLSEVYAQSCQNPGPADSGYEWVFVSQNCSKIGSYGDPLCSWLGGTCNEETISQIGTFEEYSGDPSDIIYCKTDFTCGLQTPSSCLINSFTADDTTPPYNTGTTLRLSLNGPFPWSIDLLEGSINPSPYSGTGDHGISSTGDLISTHVYRLKCGDDIRDLAIVPESQPAQTCQDSNANNFGQPLPCRYDNEDTCQDPNAGNFGQPLPCVYVQINGSCGTRNTIYPAGTTDYPPGSTYCSTGTPTSSPNLPTPWGTVTWYCVGSNGGGNSGQCAATVETPKFNVVVDAVIKVGGRVVSDDGIINCGNICSHEYEYGSNVILRAISNSSYWQFDGWAESSTCSGFIANVCTLDNITAPQTATAKFTLRKFKYFEF